MKIVQSLVKLSLGITFTSAYYEPKCGITCLSNMDCAAGKANAPTDGRGLKASLPVYHEVPVNHEPDEKMLGAAADPGMFPWMAGIYVKTKEKKGKQYPAKLDRVCGGSIINSRTILTAATCFTKENTKKLRQFVKFNSKVLVGFPYGLPNPDSTHDDISEEAKSYGQGIFDIKEIILHPRFTGKKPEEYDAAILVLKERIVYHKSIDNIFAEKRDISFGINGTVESKSFGWTRPACFANKNYDNEYLKKKNAADESKANCFASGYGKDLQGKVGKLNYVAVEIQKENGIFGLGLNHSSRSSSLLVEAVLGGPAAEWNETHPDAEVRRGDRIVAVNGFRGRSRELLQHLSQDIPFTLLVSRPEGAEVPALRSCAASSSSSSTACSLHSA